MQLLCAHGPETPKMKLSHRKQNNKFNSIAKMVPSTRLRPFHTPSPEPLANKEATTRRKCRFFDTLARDDPFKSLRYISRDIGIAESTARKWKKQYDSIGDEAKRRTRPRSKILGHKSRVTKAMCKTLVSPSNPVWKQSYEVQIEYHYIPIKRRQLQKKLKELTKGGGQYRYAFVKKQILV